NCEMRSQPPGGNGGVGKISRFEILGCSVISEIDEDNSDQTSESHEQTATIRGRESSALYCRISSPSQVEAEGPARDLMQGGAAPWHGRRGTRTSTPPIPTFPRRGGRRIHLGPACNSQDHFSLMNMSLERVNECLKREKETRQSA